MRRSLYWISIGIFTITLTSATGCNNSKKSIESSDKMESKSVNNKSESEPDANITPMKGTGASESGVLDSTESRVSKEDKVNARSTEGKEAPKAGSSEQSKIDSIKAAKAKLKK